MRKQKNKRGKNPRDKRIQTIIIADCKKNGDPNPRAGTKITIKHDNIIPLAVE